jgi:hypothetical protein
MSNAVLLRVKRLLVSTGTFFAAAPQARHQALEQTLTLLQLQRLVAPFCLFLLRFNESS